MRQCNKRDRSIAGGSLASTSVVFRIGRRRVLGDPGRTLGRTRPPRMRLCRPSSEVERGYDRTMKGGGGEAEVMEGGRVAVDSEPPNQSGNCAPMLPRLLQMEMVPAVEALLVLPRQHCSTRAQQAATTRCPIVPSLGRRRLSLRLWQVDRS